jgi:hypothetical protein
VVKLIYCWWQAFQVGSGSIKMYTKCTTVQNGGLVSRFITLLSLFCRQPQCTTSPTSLERWPTQFFKFCIRWWNPRVDRLYGYFVARWSIFTCDTIQGLHFNAGVHVPATDFIPGYLGLGAEWVRLILAEFVWPLQYERARTWLTHWMSSAIV